MDPTIADAIQTVIWELRFVRWMLFVVVLFIVAFGVALIRLIRSFAELVENTNRQNEDGRLQNELEGLLASGLARDAKFKAVEWLARQPRQPLAHWFLAKAHHQLGEVVEAKKAVKALLAIAPEWEAHTAPWLERIEEEIQSAGPRPIK